LGILVVGSVGLDDVVTPAGRRSRILGGACTYFATAASLYTQVSMVAVVGTDFPEEHVDFFRARRIDLRGLQQMEGATFFWSGRYHADMADAETLDTQVNVFADFHPVIPKDLRQAEYVFLANIDPELQIEVLDQVGNPRLVTLDSMNFWIESKREALLSALQRVDVVVLNESEVRMLSGQPNLLVAARTILELGPQALIIKRGEHGAMLITPGRDVGERFFAVPAYPLEQVIDPTGAGDTFAAGFMGFLASTGDLSLQGLRQAVVHGTILASYAVEDFSIDRLRTLTRAEIDQRYDAFLRMTFFDALAEPECRAFRKPVIESSRKP
jgi:sugar/nucleoside kinase (ribokinase family)